MKIVRFLLSYSGGLVILAVLTSIAAGLGNVGLVALINLALSTRDYPLESTVWKFAGLAIVMTLGRALSSLLLTRLSQNAVLEMRMRLSRQLLAAPLRHLEEIGPARILATLNGDINGFANGLLVVPILCLQTTMLAGCLVYLAWLSWTVFLGVLVFIIIGMGTYQLGQRMAAKYLKLAREQHDSLFSHFRAMTEGTKELKLHNRRRHAFLYQVFKDTAVLLRRHTITASAVFTAAGSWGQLLFAALIGLILFAIPAIRGGDARVIIGYTFVILYITVVLDALSSIVPSLSNANVALTKVESLGFSLVGNDAEDSLSNVSLTIPRFDSLELIGVTHSYHRERENSSFTLGPLDLSLRPGSLIFITGGNGSGKTTLGKIIAGLYAPESGEVRLNGVAITDEAREGCRQLFSAVFYDFYLFDSLLGLDQTRLDAQAGSYLTELHLDHKVHVKEGKLSTTDLSQGQRKRLALLTAYLEDRPIYLFDEWAADQDPSFKNVFYLQILPELKARGKAVVVITHDDRYYYLADHVVKLENGKMQDEEYVSSLNQAALNRV